MPMSVIVEKKLAEGAYRAAEEVCFYKVFEVRRFRLIVLDEIGVFFFGHIHRSFTPLHIFCRTKMLFIRNF